MLHRSRIVALIVLFVLAGLALGATTSGAEGSGGSAAPLDPSQIHGVNFLIKSQIDTNFCIQVENGGLPRRTVTLQTCGFADQQRWAFTDNKDGTNLILDSVGMCLDGRFKPARLGLAMTVNTCSFSPERRFVFTAEGLIEDPANGKCLSIAGAVGGAAVSLADCDPLQQGQLWNAAH